MTEKLYGKITATKLIDIPQQHLQPNELTPRFFIQVQPMKGHSVDTKKKPVTVDCRVNKEELNGQPITEGMRVNLIVEAGKKCFALVKVEKVYEEKRGGYTRPDKNRGAEVGNAINVATHLTGSFAPDVVKECAEKIIPIMRNIREDMAVKYKDMDEFARNMRLGQCFLLASQSPAFANKGWEFVECNQGDFQLAVEQWFKVGCNLESQLQ